MRRLRVRADRGIRGWCSPAAGALLLVLLAPPGSLAQQLTDRIPEGKIQSLQVGLAKPHGPGASAVAQRLALKGLMRRAQTLLASAPDAPNRFEVLAVIFDAQKRLLAMENNARNREALFDTCGQLATAPDRYAELRLEADLMLSEQRLSEENATLKERARALKGIVDRYRGTPAEAKSLLMAAVIATKLDAPELEDEILNTLDENFSDDPEVIEFRRKYLGFNRLDVTFAGRFQRLDGTRLEFPADTMGHVSLMVFWSKNKPGLDAYLDKMKEQLEPFAGRLDVFSFNVDELPDGGKSALRGHGLDWTVIQLPGGRNHQAYRTYAQGDPVAVLVNEYGLSVIRPEIVHGLSAGIDPARISGARYLAQLESLFIGDFLVDDAEDQRVSSLSPAPGAAANRPAVSGEELREIQSCFPPAPFRYRLSRAEALANYTKAAKRCADALQQRPVGPALAAIDISIDAHQLRHFRGRRSKAADWRKDAKNAVMKAPCDILAMLWATKADILEKLGRKGEAAEVRKRSGEPVAPDPPSLYGAFHEKLENWRSGEGREAWKQ